MSPNLQPATRDGKNRLMEIAISSGPSSNTIPQLTADPLNTPSITDLPIGTPSDHVPEVLSNPKFALFQQLVLSTKKSNAMKKCLNVYHQ